MGGSMSIRTLPAGLLLGLVACASSGAGHAPPAGGAEAADVCGVRGAAVQVLGSGGPMGAGGRASTGYVVWVDGRARAVVDMGGGTFQRAASLGVRVADLRAVLLTHYHVDHTADLPALLKRASFGDRAEVLPIVGPSGDGPFPPLEAFLDALVGRESGAWRYLGGMLDEGQPFALEPRQVDVEALEPSTVLTGPELRVQAVGVRHGTVPALGYAVEVGGARVAFTGDQRMDEARFVDMARGADLLVAHHAVPEDASQEMRALHAPPSRIGALAAATGASALVLSHHMQRSLDRREEGLREIRARYDGPVTLATDLDCFPLP
jgi:ribonuclease BN (tRNA processing enzyme)